MAIHHEMMKTFDIQLSATHRLGKTLIDTALQQDLCVYTIKLFPSQVENPLPSLSFIAPFNTGESICGHIHEEKRLISYLRNKESGAHICSLCKIGILKRRKVDVEEWIRKNRKFTTEIFSPGTEKPFDEEQMKRLIGFCEKLNPEFALMKFEGKLKNVYMIFAYDISDLPKKSIVGFAFFTKGVTQIYTENPLYHEKTKDELQDLVQEIWEQRQFDTNWGKLHEWFFFEKATKFVVDYIIDDRKTRYDKEDVERRSVEYVSDFENLKNELSTYI